MVGTMELDNVPFRFSVTKHESEDDNFPSHFLHNKKRSKILNSSTFDFSLSGFSSIAKINKYSYFLNQLQSVEQQTWLM